MICDQQRLSGGSEPVRLLARHIRLFQGILAGSFIAAVLFGAYLVERVSFPGGGLFPGIVASSLAASTFLIFVFPNLPTAKIHRLIWGHIIATGVGYTCYCLTAYVMGYEPGAASILSGGAAVGLSTFLMVSFRVPHPPAAGTALGFAIGSSFAKLIFVVIGVLFLGLVGCLLSRLLRDVENESLRIG
uniref:HPP family protein n=1 Tax=Candidatus Kentrum sp. FM TaxID=2126340 RepID=A0A450TF12_9GAMM|nr:MAG: HPP family protein [Candidatus Kentron sp. FM]VFJ65926.1 MAG: HPP family protein [Candidatus Kentron sp. FM]VFK15839.1 MAG: HPP family protein [Candidatus Kentron sp. FM]